MTRYVLHIKDPAICILSVIALSVHIRQRGIVGLLPQFKSEFRSFLRGPDFIGFVGGEAIFQRSRPDKPAKQKPLVRHDVLLYYFDSGGLRACGEYPLQRPYF
jgi:hypothetical protein